MLRLVHFADVHLGTENYGRIDPATGLNTRLADFTAALDRVVDRAVDDDVDLVVFAGAAYRHRDPNPTHQREFARRIRRLSEAGLPVFLLVGNHDLPAASGRAPSVDIFRTLGVPRVVVADRPEVHVVETRRGPVQIAAVPWVTRSRVLAREAARDKTPEEVNRLLADLTSQTIGDLAEQIDPALPSILVGHLSALGATYGSERSVTVGEEVLLPPSVIANFAFDYVALGHIHKHQVLADRPLTAYAGSIERVDFGEEAEGKGFMLVEIVARREARYEFVSTLARRFVTVHVKALGDDPTAQVLQAIERHDVRDAVVRVLIKTDRQSDPRLDIPEIRRALRDAYHIAAISREVLRPPRPPGTEHIEELAPEEALRRYLEECDPKPPRDRLTMLLDYGRRLIQQEPA
ncbi:MAG: exonuclease SbcCD subunit D [Chloroflexi bacterium]|nr:exonuclease SbcCD subunit D [Chloroflexota bacterium]